MTPETAVPIIKAVNRRMRRLDRMTTHDHRDLTRGWDYATWCACYPALSAVYQRACEAFTGRMGRFVPTL